jgi:outer membrane protein assembly factor BamD (BamD/ComL family)
VFCSLTNSIYNSGQSEDSLNNNNLNKSEKYFSELETLYILGKHYPKPIGVF